MAVPGDKIKLTNTSNQYSEVKIGDKGIVVLVDGNTLLVKWEIAGMVPIIEGEDEYEILSSHKVITFKLTFTPRTSTYDSQFFGNGLAEMLREWSLGLKGGFTFEIEAVKAG
jgi:hypothetical protein